MKITKKCIVCKNDFEIKKTKRPRVTCSKHCARIYNYIEKYLDGKHRREKPTKNQIITSANETLSKDLRQLLIKFNNMITSIEEMISVLEEK